jgi:hypothetical protein
MAVVIVELLRRDVRAARDETEELDHGGPFIE